MEDLTLVIQCFKCKRICDDNGIWEFVNDGEHIDCANHTICPECHARSQSEMQIKYIFNEYCGRLTNIYKDFSIIIVSDNIKFKNALFTAFSSLKVSSRLFDKQEASSSIETLKSSGTLTANTVLLYDVETNEEFEFLLQLKNTFINKTIAIIEPENANYFIKYWNDFKLDYVFKNFTHEEIILKIYKIFMIESAFSEQSKLISELKKTKMNLLNKLMVYEDGGTDSALADSLKDENEKLKNSVAELKKNLNSKNFTIIELTDKITQLEFFDKTTGFYSFYKFLEIIHREIKRIKRSQSILSMIVIKLIFFPDNNTDNFAALSSIDAENMIKTYLQQIAEIIRENIREVDLPVRLAYDKLMVALIDCGSDAAINIADRMQSTLNEIAIPEIKINIHFKEFNAEKSIAAILKFIDEFE